MKDEFRPAVEALMREVEESEKKTAETKKMVNRLCELSGEAPFYADVSLPDRRSLSALRADQFYGRALSTAAREYLEMRGAADLGPAAPREIFEALTSGGFKFETANDVNAIISIRATLRKNSSMFHRLPNGQYGLLAWYPKVKAARTDGNGEEETAARSSVRAAAKPKPVHRQRSAAKETRAKTPIAPIVQDLMKDGAVWTTASLRMEALSRGAPGINESTTKNVFQGALLGLKKRGLVEQVDGGWRRVHQSDDGPTVVPLRSAG